MIYSDDGNLILGYKLKLFEKYSLSEINIDEVNEIFNRAFKDLETDTIVLKQDLFFNEQNNTDDWIENNYLNKSLKEYFSKYNITGHHCYIFFVSPYKRVINTAISNPFKKINRKELEDLDKKHKVFLDSVQSCINYLEDVRITGQSLVFTAFDDKELFDYKDYCMSGFSDAQLEIKKEWEHLRIGTNYSNVIRFSDEAGFPEKLQTSIIDEDLSQDEIKFFKNYGDCFTFGIDCNHIYNQLIIIDETDYHIENAQKNNNHINQCRAFHPINKVLKDQHNELIESIIESKDVERIVRGHNNIVLLGSEEEVSNGIKQVKNSFKKLDLKYTITSGDNQLAIYLYSNPFYCHLFVENQLFVSTLDVCCAFMNYSTNYRSDDTGVIFCSRLKNTPVKVDTWDAEKKYMKARNGIIFSPTGGGKSFLANHLITHYYSTGAKQVIIDLGGSYKKISALFPKDSIYISYREGQSLGINPFMLYDIDYEKGKLISEKIEDLAEFVGIHYKREESINDKERVVIKKLIEQYYKDILEDHSFKSFIDYFNTYKESLYQVLELNDEFLDSKAFTLMLSEFIGNGIYANLYENDNNAILKDLQNKSLVIFELDKIRDNKFLLKIMLQVIASTIRTIVWEDRNTKGIIWFDEVAEQLKWQGMLDRIEWFFQAIRKQEGAINIILQAITQLPESNVADNIITNTQVLYVLNADDFTRIQKRFNLSQHALYQMQSMKDSLSTERKHTSLFIRRGDRQQVFHLEVSKTNYWAYQTEGAENEKLLKLYEQTGDMEEAIAIKMNEDKKN